MLITFTLPDIDAIYPPPTFCNSQTPRLLLLLRPTPRWHRLPPFGGGKHLTLFDGVVGGRWWFDCCVFYPGHWHITLPSVWPPYPLTDDGEHPGYYQRPTTPGTPLLPCTLLGPTLYSPRLTGTTWLFIIYLFSYDGELPVVVIPDVIVGPGQSGFCCQVIRRYDPHRRLVVGPFCDDGGDLYWPGFGYCCGLTPVARLPHLPGVTSQTPDCYWQRWWWVTPQGWADYAKLVFIII